MAAERGGLSEQILQRCAEFGFAAAGVCDARPTSFGDAFRGWLKTGKHGSMTWLGEHVDVRLDPSKLIDDGARSVVMVADVYAARAENVDQPLRPGHGRVARYARGRDYHKVIKKRLHGLCDELRERFPGEAFRAFVDTAPALERELATRCGIGWQAKHTLTIHPRLGSYLLLGGVATTLELPTPLDQSTATDHCGTCTRCIDACPTDAISPYSVDATRCISYLTIERRDVIDPAFFRSIGGWLFGCDICQEVCPHNSPKIVPEPNPAYRGERSSFNLLEVLDWSAEDRTRELRGSAMKRATLDMFRRNAVIALSNLAAHTGDASTTEAIRSIAERENEVELVRSTARAALARLDADGPSPS